MSLDAPKSDAELLRMHAERTGKRVNGIELGVASPLLENPEKRERAAPARREGVSEHDIQAAAFARINDPAEQLRRPALALVHAVPNGGQRNKRTAGMLKAEGQKPGVPDIDCPVARGGYFGLRIEVKRPGESLKPSQADWLNQLEREGHKVAVHESADGIWYELVAYLDLPRTPLTPRSPR